MRISVLDRAVEYGGAIDFGVEGEGDAALDVERKVMDWAPVRPARVALPWRVVFVDGVERVDASLLIEDEEKGVMPAVCGSYGAGAVSIYTLENRAEFLGARVERGIFAYVEGDDAVLAEGLSYGWNFVAGEGDRSKLSERMSTMMERLERDVVLELVSSEVVVIKDGVVRGLPVGGVGAGAVLIGYIKSHFRRYLPDEVARASIYMMRAGDRTPLFGIGDGYYSWYLRLPGEVGHVWESVARLEVRADDVGGAVEAADMSCSLLPGLAAPMHKDARAPVNLLPIRWLEKRLRREMGSRDYIAREIRLRLPGAVSQD